MSKIRYPPRLVILGYVHIFVWLFLTYIMQITSWPEDDKYKPIYYENLNWACQENFSYTYLDSTKKTVGPNSTDSMTCKQREINDSTLTSNDCHNLFRTYYCDIEGLDLQEFNDLNLKPWNWWTQCGCLVTTILLMYTISSFVLYTFHKWKTSNTKGYIGPKQN